MSPASPLRLAEENWPQARRHLERAAALAHLAEVWSALAHLAARSGDRNWLKSHLPQLAERFRDDVSVLTGTWAWTRIWTARRNRSGCACWNSLLNMTAPAITWP